MMPTSSLFVAAREHSIRWWPEACVAALALVIFTGALGSVEMWGKREQRAALEAVDTLDQGHWMVARIQGHPRLEKPPLSRWSIATLMALTGRRDELIVRLPSAISGILVVGLVYGLGCRLRNRSLGLASSLILCATPFFISEMRQAGNDSLLTLFTTLALFSGWRRLGVGDVAWSRIFWIALGFGILAKGPVILLIVGATIIPSLAIAGSLRGGSGRLVDAWGIAAFLALSLVWPALVVLDDPHALGVWGLEMGQKTGLTRLMEHREHDLLVLDWPGIVMPWFVLGLLALALPFLGPRENEREVTAGGMPKAGWFVWCWAVVNLILFCLWRVAKPSYYLPCMPGLALLLGMAWTRLGLEARGQGREGILARLALQSQWVLLFAGAIASPAISRPYMLASVWPWMILLAAALAISVVGSVWLWRKGSDVLSLAPFATASAVVVLVGYGIIAPAENPDRGLRRLATSLQRIAPSGESRILFLQEIDEGLSFHLGGRLQPVPGTERRYNASYDYVDDYLNKRREQVSRKQVEAQAPLRLREALLSWVERERPSTDYLILPTRFYDRFAADLSPSLVPVLREEDLKRNELIVLKTRVKDTSAIATAPEAPVGLVR